MKYLAFAMIESAVPRRGSGIYIVERMVWWMKLMLSRECEGSRASAENGQGLFG